MARLGPFFSQFVVLLLACLRDAGPTPVPSPSVPPDLASQHHTVLILGGGVAGVIAARTLHQAGIDDFIIVEARNELGGRMQTHAFGAAGNQWVVEQGPNWIQGTQTGDGPTNPIFALKKKHDVKSQVNDCFGSITTYDASGQVDYLDVLNESGNNFANLTVLAGARLDAGLVDTSARAGYSLIGVEPMDSHARASEYFHFDWEYAQTPENSSLLASSWGNNFTYHTDQGGFSDISQMSIDQRGFKSLIQLEADTFIQPRQKMFNATVKTVSRSDSGVTVALTNGTTLSADFALCTFSLGVLQNDDVIFEPALPDFKQEAIQGMVMGTYTKIFLQFPHKFWFDTEMGLYADPERGRYPIWQSLDHPNFFPGSGIIFVTVTGNYSARADGLPDSQVREEVMGVIRSMFPNITVPEPTDFFFPRWRSNPLFRGSYSNWPPSFSSQHLDNLRANVGRLYFAGEATSRKYFGFLHGAYFEGLEIGGKIAACINNSTCSDLERFVEVNSADPYEGVYHVDGTELTVSQSFCEAR